MKNTIRHIEAMGFPWQTRDPFLFTAHHRDAYPAGDAALAVPEAMRRGRPLGNDFQMKDGFRMYHGKSVPGFPVHPHRGFETITINLEGYVDHSDSLGAAGRFGKGDVQWMTAGKGVQHSEMFPLVRSDRENPLEIFQIWLNLPARSKMVEPYFRMLWKETIPRMEFMDEQGKKSQIELFAGSLDAHTAPPPTPDSWAADPGNGVLIFTLDMEPGARWTLPASSIPGVNRSLYFYQGSSLDIEGTVLPAYHMADLHPERETTLVNGGESAGILILQGLPIGEPVAMHGPFVMNTQEEILQTFEAYRRTQFGGWPWDGPAPNHGRDRGRFARHADGRVEEP